jgi:HAD superfamily phosphoserine phosphatase-like hydrolase
MAITCIIPAYNEESTIASVLRIVKKVRSIDQILVVDDGSIDRTYINAKSEKVKVIRHEINMGKGAAIKTGVAHSSGDILLFLDADLSSLTPKKITSILRPLATDEADFVKTSFTRSRGRVTELVAKPLFRVLFPFMNFSQPLSGQFAIRKDLISGLKIDDKWGVDIQILLQAMKKGVRIAEVDIGRLRHKKQPIGSLAIMSEEVIRSILSEIGVIANKHKLVAFDFDKTLIRESSIEVVAEHLGFTDKLEMLRAEHSGGRINDFDITLNLAKLLCGRRDDDLAKALRKINLRRTAAGVVDRLKKRQYHVGIISLAFSPIVCHFANKLGIENVICPVLIKDRNGRFTGEVKATTRHNSTCCDSILCKGDALKELMENLGVKPEECIAVGDGKSDRCMFLASGLSLAYRPLIPVGDVRIQNLAEVLIHAD